MVITHVHIARSGKREITFGIDVASLDPQTCFEESIDVYSISKICRWTPFYL